MKWPNHPQRLYFNLFVQLLEEYPNATESEFKEALASRELVPMEWVVDPTYGHYGHHAAIDLKRKLMFFSALAEIHQAESVMRESLLFTKRHDRLGISWKLGFPRGEIYSETSHYFGDDITNQLFALGAFLEPGDNVGIPDRFIIVTIYG